MTGLSGGGIACDTLDGAARASVNQSCAVYAGWNDYCSGCTADPSKWGYASGDACTNGAGVDDTCTQPTLGGNVVNLFGLSPDNNVDGADTFRTSLHCTAPAATTSSGAATCPTGQFVTAVTGGTVECATIADLAASYFGSQCTLYAGWRDGCNACTQDPVKWVGSNDADCSTSGTYTVCTQPALGTESVRLGGYGTEGDVDGNDSFYLGLRCTGAAASGGTQTGACPAGQFVTEVKPNGDVTCTGAATAIEAYVRSGCYVYAGWRDSCNGCTSDPTKWGRASDAACEVGANGSCLTSTLGTESVNLVVYDTDGDVNGDDKFYYGLKCY